MSASAQTVATDPVGFVKFNTLASSDTIFAAPLERASEFQGYVASVAGGVVTVTGTPGWTANQFLFAEPTQPKTYYLRFLTGARAGAFFTVLGNTADSLTLDLNGESIATVAVNDRLSITPYWTLGALFPASDAGVSFEASASFVIRKTEVMFVNQNWVGVNPSASSIFFFYNGAWRKVGSLLTTSFDNSSVILPDGYMIIRNKAGFAGNMTVVGSVLMTPIQIGLNSYPAAKQDNVVSIVRPIDVSLDQSGLISSGAFVPSTSFVLRKDELYVYDNSVPGTNKSASAIYYYYNGAWRRVGGNIADNYGSTLAFKTGMGVIIRKAANGVAPETVNWSNSATY